MAAIAPARRLPAQSAPTPPPEVQGVNFGSDSFYSGGAFVPDGDYCLFFDVRNHQGKDTNIASRLGVFMQAFQLGDPKAEALTQFYSMGTGANKSFVPNATGTGLLPIAGAPAFNLNDKTNWNELRKSILNCGAPEFGGDISNWNGMWVHIHNVPEPEERKGFRGAQTAEVQQEVRNRTIPIVSAIYPDGEPWNNTGGVPEQPVQPGASAPAPTPTRAATPAARPTPPTAPGRVAPPTRSAAPAPAPAVQAGTFSDEDVTTFAINGVSTVLSQPKFASGMARAALRLETVKTITASDGAEAATAVIDTYFSNDESLKTLLASLQYGLKGLMIAPL